MDANDLIKVLLVTSGGLLASTIGFAIAWVRARERLLRSRTGTRDPRDAGRSDRIDQAVEAIALEVERIGEQQRFLTKMLAEDTSAHMRRAESAGSAEALRAPVTPARTVTPH